MMATAARLHPITMHPIGRSVGVIPTNGIGGAPGLLPVIGLRARLHGAVTISTAVDAGVPEAIQAAY